MKTLRWPIGAIFAIAFAQASSAQTVSGSVVMPDTITPVPGAIVMAVDAQGATVGRSLTNTRGTFVLRLSSPGTVDLRVLRIGYNPLKGPSLAVAAGATQQVRIIYTASLVTLAAVNVQEGETCRVQRDSGLLVATLWEEARKAMLTSRLASDEPPLFAEWIEYVRTLDSASRVVRAQRIRTSRNPTTHVFQSVPGGILRTAGYVVEDSSTTTYYAPDAQVLLSEDFVETHCFHLVAPPRTEDQRRIGIAFTPTPDRRRMKEIEGTLWVDRTTTELRTLEFRYLNLDKVTAPAKPGGNVDFMKLSDGNWLVSRWQLRMPQLYDAPAENLFDNRRLYLAHDLVLRAVQHSGGEVVRAIRHDSVVYEGAGARIDVQVLARDSSTSVAGAILDLDGTDYTAVADASGRIHLSPLLPGRYMARLHSPSMDAMGVPGAMREIEARMDPRVDSLMLPNPANVLASACPADSGRSAQGMLHGWVKGASTTPIGHASITVNWRDDYTLTQGAVSQISYGAKTLGTVTNDAGYWRICGIPPTAPVSVRVVSDSGSDLREAHLNGRAFLELNLVPRHPVATTGPAGTQTRALVEVGIADNKGAPLAEATLEVLPLGGTPLILVTGPSGKVTAPDIAPGMVSVRARRLGYMEGFVTVSVSPGRNTIPIIMSNVSAPAMDTIRVVGDRIVKGRNSGFEERKLRRQANAVFSREDILKRNPVSLWEMLQGVQSVRVDDFSGARYAYSTRSNYMDEKGSPCFLRVAVDGLVQLAGLDHVGFDLNQLPPPSEIHGIEVFAGAATLPIEFAGIGDGKGCGLIAIWTK